MFVNIEIKARCHDPQKIRDYLLSKNAEFKGVDEQTDTYFRTKTGRLKLREGLIENNLIFYQRPDQSGPKTSHFELIKFEESFRIKAVLASTNGILKVVKKKREIYFIENVKFHIDTVPGLGYFMEIEAGNKTNSSLGEPELLKQCDQYMSDLNIQKEDLVESSYSDMLSDNNGAHIPA